MLCHRVPEKLQTFFCISIMPVVVTEQTACASMVLSRCATGVLLTDQFCFCNWQAVMNAVLEQVALGFPVFKNVKWTY